MANRFKFILLISVLIMAVFGAGWWSSDYHKGQWDIRKIHEVRKKGDYKLINPLYECEVDGEEYLKEYIPFESIIETRINNEVQAGKNFSLALYFRNLNNGPTFGINQSEEFSPASLLKVPLMIAYFKKAEANQEILSRRFAFNAGPEDSLEPAQQIVPAIWLESGMDYSVEELIRRMIVYSDNDAMSILMKNISQEDIYHTYSDLGVANPFKQNIESSISVKSYASFFRILYNAAYLNEFYSEKALALLAESDFRGGLVAGVPADIEVAHKFGERELDNEQYPEQFHDCGIVYYEKYPYLLCVMTRGSNKQELIEAIKNTSRIVFEEIAHDYPEK
jgi:beta-lactamase class A